MGLRDRFQNLFKGVKLRRKDGLLKEWVTKNKGEYVSVEHFFEPTHGKKERDEQFKKKGELLGVFTNTEHPGYFYIKIRMEIGREEIWVHPERIAYCDEIPSGIVLYEEAILRETVLRLLPVTEEILMDKQVYTNLVNEFQTLETELGQTISKNIRNLTKPTDSPIMKEAVEELRKIRDERLIRFIILGLVQEFAVGFANYWTQASRVLAKLGQLNPSRFQKEVIEALTSRNEELRHSILLVLVSSSPEKEDYPPLWKYLDEKAVPALIQAYKITEGPGVKPNLTRILGEIADKRAVEALIESLEHSSERVREEAAWALGNVRDEKAVEPLSRALKDENERVQKTAKEALKKIKSK